MKFIQTQTSLKSGRLSRKLDGRVDIKEYSSGCRVLENMLVEPEGGGRKVAGVHLDSDGLSGPIVSVAGSSVQDFFTIEGDEYRMFMYKNGTNNIEIEFYTHPAGAAAYSTTIPTLNQVEPEEVDYVQYENFIYFVTPIGTTPLKIFPDGSGGITGGAFFSGYSPTQFEYPYIDFPLSGNVYLKISSSGTKAEVVDSGGTVQTGTNNICNYVDTTEYIYVVGIVDVGGVKQVHSNFYFVTLKDDVAGNVTITPRYLRAGTSNDYLGDGTYQEWAYPAWGNLQGYPTKVCSVDSRLVFGGTPKAPLTIYGSMVGNPGFFGNKRLITSGLPDDGFNYFDQGGGNVVNTDPYVFTLATKRDTVIQFMENARNFIIGTDRHIYIDKTEGLLGPLNVNFQPEVSTPCGLRVTSFAENIYYTAAEEKKVYLFKYSDANGSYIQKELSLLNRDLYEDSTVKQLLMHPLTQTLFVVMEDGSFHGITVEESSEVLAYSTFDIPDFTVDNMAFNYEDGLLYLVLVSTNGIGYLTATWDINVGKTDMKDFLTSRLQYLVSPAQTSWLYGTGNAGDTVWWINADDETEYGTAVLDGSLNFTTDNSYERLYVGKAQEGEVCLMPVEAGAQFGTAQTAIKRVDQVGIRYYKSRGFRIKEQSSSFDDEYIVSPDGEEFVTGHEIVALSSESSEEQVICVKNDQPEPFNVLAVTLRGVANDG